MVKSRFLLATHRIFPNLCRLVQPAFLATRSSNEAVGDGEKLETAIQRLLLTDASVEVWGVGDFCSSITLGVIWMKVNSFKDIMTRHPL